MLLIPSSIVAIHSPNKNPIKSFTSTATGKFWLGDEDMLPKDIPNSRVLTFSYSSSDSIMASATQLVESLVHNRYVREVSCSKRAHSNMQCLQSEGSIERPIMFICHSVGGIIAKQVFWFSIIFEGDLLIVYDRH